MRLNLYSSVLFCCCFPVLSIFFVLVCSVLTQLLRFLFLFLFFCLHFFVECPTPRSQIPRLHLYFWKSVCVDFGGLWDRTRGGIPPVLPNSWICSIFELVKWKNFSLAVSSILNLNVLFQRRMCLLFSLRFYISFHLLFRAILSHALNCIECSRTVLFVWPFFNWLG